MKRAISEIQSYTRMTNSANSIWQLKNYIHMKKIYIYLLLLLIATSCNTGRKSLSKGDYYQATLQAVQFLRTKPDSEKALATVTKSYPMALQYYRQKVEEYSKTNATDKYLRINDIYTKLNILADEISRSPAALEAVKPVVYFHDQLAKSKEMAANEQFQLAENLLKTGYIDDARIAVSKLDIVKSIKPNFPGIDQKLSFAQNAATLKVVVETIPVNSRNMQISAQVFYDHTYTELKRRASKEFVRFYRSDEAEELKIMPHHIVRMQFNDFVVGNVYEKETEKPFTRDSVVVGHQNNLPVYGTVKVKALIHDREVVSKGSLNVQIIDYSNNQSLTSRNFPGEYVWRNSWANFNGDERALPDNILALTKMKQQTPPPPQDLFLLFNEPIFENSTSFVSNYYRKK